SERSERSERSAGGETMIIIPWLLFGLLVGALARWVVPGKDPMGLVGTFGLGLAGSLVGGLLAFLLLGRRGVGLVASVGGSVLVLLAYRALSRRRVVTR
ncbi:MAG: GlsB/YeaQ/YmgE family stress response membrane protein, partial [Acidimicrobiia bacterium]